MDKAEKIKRKKIRQLEAEIAAMQRENARIFGEDVSKTKLNPFTEAIVFIMGVLCSGFGLIEFFKSIGLTAGFAALSITGNGLPKAVYAVPIAAGLIVLLTCKKKNVAGVIFFMGLAAAALGCAAGLIPLGAILKNIAALILVFFGLSLLVYTFVRHIIRRKGM